MRVQFRKRQNAPAFRRVRIVAKSPYQIHVRPPVRQPLRPAVSPECPHVWARFPLERFTCNLILCHFYENLSRKSKFGENRGKNTGYFARRPQYVLSVAFEIKKTTASNVQIVAIDVTTSLSLTGNRDWILCIEYEVFI